MEDKFQTYTVDEVMDILRLTRRTIHKYIRKGLLRGCKVGNAWRITNNQLQDFLEKTEKK
jgi:excisionase family DNA binding protein